MDGGGGERRGGRSSHELGDGEADVSPDCGTEAGDLARVGDGVERGSGSRRCSNGL